jgi:hypothetical protein
METMHRGCEQRFRIWIASYSDWTPLRWNESPPRATALEPAADVLYTAAEAALFLEGFNSSILDTPQPIWAVAVPISVRYEGDAIVGMPLCGQNFPLAQPAAILGTQSGETFQGETFHGEPLQGGSTPV